MDKEARHWLRAHKLARTFTEKQQGKLRTAGEVRFIKDDGSLDRTIPAGFHFRPKSLKPLTKTAWSLSCALGHLLSAANRFSRIKSVTISPDGRLGGKGYIQEVSEMRKKLAEAIENVSSIVDTLHDEIRAPHWTPEVLKGLSDKDQAEIDEMLEDSMDILDDPESYEAKEYQDEVVEDAEEAK